MLLICALFYRTCDYFSVCEMLCSVDVCIYSIIVCFSDCHGSTCAFLIVMLLIYALFYRTCDYVSVCEML